MTKKLRTRLVTLTVSEVPVYIDREAIPCECPEHGPTYIESPTMGGIRLGCGCEWQRGGGDLEGWFRQCDKKPIAKRQSSGNPTRGQSDRPESAKKP